MTPRQLFVHRKGATRAFGPGNADLPEALRDVGQPVLIGGSMGTAPISCAEPRAASSRRSAPPATAPDAR